MLAVLRSARSTFLTLKLDSFVRFSTASRDTAPCFRSTAWNSRAIRSSASADGFGWFTSLKN